MVKVLDALYTKRDELRQQIGRLETDLEFAKCELDVIEHQIKDLEDDGDYSGRSLYRNGMVGLAAKTVQGDPNASAVGYTPDTVTTTKEVGSRMDDKEVLRILAEATGYPVIEMDGMWEFVHDVDLYRDRSEGIALTHLALLTKWFTSVDATREFSWPKESELKVTTRRNERGIEVDVYLDCPENSYHHFEIGRSEAYVRCVVFVKWWKANHKK